MEPCWSRGVQHLGGLYDPLESIQPFRHIPTFRRYFWLCSVHTRRKHYHRPFLPARERQSFSSLSYLLGTVAGPTFGGFIVEHVDWSIEYGGSSGSRV